jgi:transposase InsO family protein
MRSAAYQPPPYWQQSGASVLAVGWALTDHLEASLAIEAFDRTLAARDPAPVTRAGSAIRLRRQCRKACGARRPDQHEPRWQPLCDNAKAERFMRTLKEEEVDDKIYAFVDEVRTHIGAFLEGVYNRGRLHSALGYKPPVEFEAELRQTETV